MTMSFTEILKNAAQTTCDTYEKLIAAFETEKFEFAAYRAETIEQIGKDRMALDNRKTEMDVRESHLASREANVSNIQGIASARKGQIITLQQNQAELTAQKNEAMAKMRAAEEAQKKLKEALATTLTDNVWKDKQIAELQKKLDDHAAAMKEPKAGSTAA